MKTSLVVILALVALAYATPIQNKDKGGANCGLRYAKEHFEKLVAPRARASVTCEICLDIVQIIEMYSECEESYQDKKIDEYCKTHAGAFAIICVEMVDQIMAELEKDSSADASTVCTRVMKHDCHYA
uniref:Saposin B-type domain-containing protein n=1 Tax=Rhabditophanes sp. KR3021 TaxID=114890 RepID=A0AC35U1I5_9BILA